jgi:type IV secretion system protein VirD4
VSYPPDAVFVAAILLVTLGAASARRIFWKSTLHGSAGWGRTPKAFCLKKGAPLPPGAIFLAQTRRHTIALPWEIAAQHGVIIGGSGTGKSRSYVFTTAAFSGETSLVVTDPKGELWRYTSGRRPSAIRFAPAEPHASACLNWVPLCRDARIAELCARSIVESGSTGREEQVWLTLEVALLAALFAHAATLPVPTPVTAYRLFTAQPQEVWIKQLLDSQSPIAREQANVFLQTQERMRGSIVPVLAARLQWLRDDAVARFTSASVAAPDFGVLRRQPMSLYWCLREQDIARLRGLTSLFYSLLLEQIAGEEIPEDEASVPIVCLLDEFANIGVIPSFDTTISLARGRGIGLWLGIQSLSQLEARYGKANAQTILTNCATKIALHGLDTTTARYFSETLGEGTVAAVRKARQKRSAFLPATSTTLTEHEHGRPLLTADEVRRLGRDQAIAVVSNLRPLLLPKYFYDLPSQEAASPDSGLGPAKSISLLPSSVRKLLPPPVPEELETAICLPE